MAHALPGRPVVDESSPAVEWTAALGVDFHEVEIEANAHKIRLVFSDLAVAAATRATSRHSDRPAGRTARSTDVPTVPCYSPIGVRQSHGWTDHGDPRRAYSDGRVSKVAPGCKIVNPSDARFVGSPRDLQSSTHTHMRDSSAMVPVDDNGKNPERLQSCSLSLRVIPVVATRAGMLPGPRARGVRALGAVSRLAR